jgi:integrase
MAHIQDRSNAKQAAFRVRWRDGRAAPERTYTFTSPRLSRGQSEAERAARRLGAYVDLMGHHLGVVAALVGAGFRVEGFPGMAAPESADDPPVTVADYAARWLAMLSRPNPRTRDDYRKTLELHILPVLGALDITKLTREHIALWLRAKEESLSGRAAAGGVRRAPRPATLANWHGVLSTMLEEAARDGVRAGNPARGLGPTPKSLHREMCFLTHTEWAILHRCLRRKSGRTTAHPRVDPTFGQHLATLLAGTGLRWSEATALTVGQCNLLARVPLVRIDRAWKRQPDGTYCVADPKSRRSVRSVAIADHVRDVLVLRTAGKRDTELVFPAPQGGQFLSAWFHTRYWKPALARATEEGLLKQPRVHDLRHTHAAWLIAEGRPLPSIQARLGHESISTTIDRYGHLMPDLDTGNAAAIDRAFAIAFEDTTEEPAATINHAAAN